MAGSSKMPKLLADIVAGTDSKTVEEKELIAMDDLIKGMLRNQVYENRKIKVGSIEAYHETRRLFSAMSDSEKNNYRDIFRESLRNKIIDPEAYKGPVLTVADDSHLMRKGIEAIQALDAHRAAQQQNSPEEKGDSPYEGKDSDEPKDDSPKDKGKGKRLFSDDDDADAGGHSSKRVARD